MRRRGFFRFIARGLVVRKGRVALAWSCLTLAVTLIAVLLQLTLGIREQVGAELRAYGANLIVSPGESPVLDAGSVSRIARGEDVEDAAGQVYARVRVGDRFVEAIGMDLAGLRAGAARIEGGWPAAPGEILAGSRLRESLGLAAGSPVTLEYGGRAAQLLVTGFVEKGGEEDRAFFLTLPDAWALTDRPDQLDAILVRARPGAVEPVGRRIRELLPRAAVKTLRQVALAEENLLGKMVLLMAMTTTVVLIVSGIGVAGSVSANLLERRVEVGLMKALGGTRGEIARFHRAEAALVGLAAGVSGFLLAGPVAGAISRGAFGTAPSPSPLVLAAALAAGVLLSTLAGELPLRRGLALDPAAVLRGE